MPRDKCHIFCKGRVVRGETREPVTFRDCFSAVLNGVIGVELVFSSDRRLGLIRDINEIRPAPRAPPVHLLRYESIGFAEQLNSTVSTRTRPYPALHGGKKLNLRIRNTFSKVRCIKNHKTIPEMGKISTPPIG